MFIYLDNLSQMTAGAILIYFLIYQQLSLFFLAGTRLAIYRVQTQRREKWRRWAGMQAAG
jgi:hypothetical protein